MKVTTEKIKARFVQLQQEGMKVQAALELNAGFNDPALAAIQAIRSDSSSLPSAQEIVTVPVNN